MLSTICLEGGGIGMLLCVSVLLALLRCVRGFSWSVLLVSGMVARRGATTGRVVCGLARRLLLLVETVMSDEDRFRWASSPNTFLGFVFSGTLLTLLLCMLFTAGLLLLLLFVLLRLLAALTCFFTLEIGSNPNAALRELEGLSTRNKSSLESFFGSGWFRPVFPTLRSKEGIALGLFVLELLTFVTFLRLCIPGERRGEPTGKVSKSSSGRKLSPKLAFLLLFWSRKFPPRESGAAIPGEEKRFSSTCHTFCKLLFFCGDGFGGCLLAFKKSLLT
ncbi:hypothetical protein AGDE_13000 [Angomonas deanei]|nr:hypothetical protein AGDE_13000 [Angomonas deanei]|eukprot:EPY23177.1 hypothetical protein AGDE_13000 [Angomonas deanei]